MGLCSSSTGPSTAITTAASPTATKKNPEPVVIIIETTPAPKQFNDDHKKPLLQRQESVLRAEQARIEAQRKAEEAQNNINSDHIRNIKTSFQKVERSSRNLSKQQFQVQGSSRRLQEFAPREPEEEEAELEYDATTKKFIVKKNGQVTSDDEAAKYIPGSQQGDSELVWDAAKKKYVVKGGTVGKTQQAEVAPPAQEQEANTETEVVKPRPIHHGAICISCAKSPELLILSLLVGALNAEHKCIQGVRYLSATIKDFNLCEACEKIGHLISAGPFFKITDPEKAPTDANVVIAEILNPELRPAQGFSIHVGVSCDGCKISDKLCLISCMCGRNVEGTIIGTRYKSARVNNFDLCEICESSEIFDEKCGPFLKIEVPCVIPLIMTTYNDGSIVMVQ